MGMKKFLLGLVGIVCALFTISAYALPAGYTELEYIESTGTQWIDTGVGLNAANKITGKISFVTLNTLSYIAGGRLSDNKAVGYALYATAHSGFTIYNTSWPEQGVAVSANQILEFETVMKNGQQSFTVNGNKILTGETYISFDSNTISLFGLKTEYDAAAKIYYLKIYNNDTLVRDFVPAKNSSDVVGMYDMVSGTFFENSGTGTFIAGPVVDNSCRNLFNKNASYALFDGYIKSADVGQNTTLEAYDGGDKTIIIKVAPNTTYTVTRATNLGSRYDRIRCAAFTTLPVGGSTGVILSNIMNETQANATFTTLSDTQYVAINVKNSGTFGNDWTQFINAFQLEQGSTATAYVPYCVTDIKVASTKYVESQFSALNTALANAVATVNTVVTQTIAQAASIATLQSGKQTRPADNAECPAYKQCLLVEDESGTPHWYEITDPFRDFFTPIIANQTNGNTTAQQAAILGYTQLEYIESTGTQWIDTGVYLSSNHAVEFVAKGVGDFFGTRSTVTQSYASFGVTGRSTLDMYKTTAEIYEGGRLTVQNTTPDEKYIYHVESGNKWIKNADTGTVLGISNYVPPAFTIPEYTAPIFNIAWSAPASERTPSRGSLYSFKIWNNGTLIRNFVPVIDNTTGKVGMYDTVGGRFYGNAATSGADFTPGPIVENDANVPVPTWYVDWNANSAINLSAGTAIGTAVCNSSPAGATPITDSGWNTVGAYCWCKLTGINVGGEYTAAPDAAPWKKIYTFDGATNCATGCNGYCAYHFRNQNSTRVSLTEF